jgi:hypothetical protein
MTEAARLEQRIREGFGKGNDNRVPYESNISQEKHEKIREAIESWLIKNNVASENELERFRANHRKIINDHRWEMMRDNPEQYWAMVYAYALGPTKGEKFSHLIGPYIENPKDSLAYTRYFKNQLAWGCVGVYLFRNRYGRDPTTEEENLIARRNSPIYRAAYAIWRNVMGEELTYPWADEIVKAERARKVKTVTCRMIDEVKACVHA